MNKYAKDNTNTIAYQSPHNINTIKSIPKTTSTSKNKTKTKSKKYSQQIDLSQSMNVDLINKNNNKNTKQIDIYQQLDKLIIADCNTKDQKQIQQDIKSMRSILVQFNSLLSTKLSKYQLTNFTPKTMQISHQPQKQSQLLHAKITINTKILQSLQKQIQQLIQQDKDLQQNDYLIQLQQQSNKILENIKQIRKQKHQGKVTVQKLDNKLLEKRQIQNNDQFKMVKVIKHNVLYYFKKYNQNQKILQQLNKNYQQLQLKDQQITQKLKKYIKIAQTTKMLVKTNKKQNKIRKITDQLLIKIQINKRNIEVIRRSKQSQSQRIRLQIEMYKKQLYQNQIKIQEFIVRDKEVNNNMDSIIQRNRNKNKGNGNMLDKIRYKFVENIVKSKEIKQQQQQTGNKIVVKQKLSPIKYKSINKSIQHSSPQYRTLNVKNRYNNNKTTLDKSLPKISKTIQFQQSPTKQKQKNKQFTSKNKQKQLTNQQIQQIQLDANQLINSQLINSNLSNRNQFKKAQSNNN